MAASDHDFTDHIKCMEKLCRICGSTLTISTIYIVKDHLNRLTSIFNINCDEDISVVHPKSFCNKCYCTILNSENRKVTATVTPEVWYPHSYENCQICHRLKQQAKGGRPARKTKKNKGNPKKRVCNEVNRDESIIITNDILQLTPSKTIPAHVEKLVSHVISIKIKQSKLANSTVQLPTKGPQVCKYINI